MIALNDNVKNYEIKEPEPEFAGYVNQIRLGSKIYKLRCEVVEIYPMTCPKYGGQVELK